MIMLRHLRRMFTDTRYSVYLKAYLFFQYSIDNPCIPKSRRISGLLSIWQSIRLIFQLDNLAITNQIMKLHLGA